MLFSRVGSAHSRRAGILVCGAHATFSAGDAKVYGGTSSGESCVL